MQKNKINQVYKLSPIGHIPDDWKLKRLGDICQIYGRIGYRGYTTNDIVPKGEGAITLSPSNFKNGYIDCTECTYISWFKYDESPEIQIANNDILLVKTGSTFGKSAFVKNLIEKATINPQLIVIKNIKSDVKFLSYVISDSLIQKQINAAVVGGAIPTLSQENILNFTLPYPPLSEQQKIADILSTWDDAISKTQQLINKLKERNCGLQQLLLTGRKRLKGFDQKWKRKKLNDCLIYTPREVPKPSSSFFALGIRSHGKGIFHKNDFDPEDLAMDVLFEVKENDFILNITFAWEQAVAIAGKQDDGGLVSHRFPTYTFNSKNAIPEYFRHFIIQKYFKYQLDFISPGGAGRNRVLSKKDFLKLEVIIPEVDEQLAIANVLNHASLELRLTEQKLETLKHQKKGLMQQLLTGKKRVL